MSSGAGAPLGAVQCWTHQYVGSEPAEEGMMQTDDMEVPIINNLNDNGDRLRPKGKDAFKDQQKESEVNRRGVCVHSPACSICKVRALVCVVAGEL